MTTQPVAIGERGARFHQRGDRRPVSLSAQRGRTVVLYFYPKDSTPGCTTETQEFGDASPAFAAAGAVVFGISRDSAQVAPEVQGSARHSVRAASPTPTRRSAPSFGVMKMKNMYGKQVRGIERSTFVLDARRHAREAWRGVKVPGHVAEVLARSDRCDAAVADASRPALAFSRPALHHRRARAGPWRTRAPPVPAHACRNPPIDSSSPQGRPTVARRFSRRTVGLCVFAVARPRRRRRPRPFLITRPQPMPLPKLPARPAVFLTPQTPSKKRTSRLRASGRRRGPPRATEVRRGDRARPPRRSRTPRGAAGGVASRPPGRAARRSAAETPAPAAPRRRSSRCSSRAAREGAGRRGQALRARHERADARPVGAVPLRGARRLSADDDARGTRRPQEGHVGSRAQRAPGQPLARRAGRQHAGDEAIEDGIALAALGNKDAGGRLFFQTQADHRAAAEGLPAGKADNQILGVVRALQDATGRARSCWCRKTSTCASRRARSGLPAEDYFNDHVLEDTDLLYAGMRAAAGRFLGQARQGHGELAGTRTARR